MCNLKPALIPQPLLPAEEGEPIWVLAPLPFWACHYQHLLKGLESV